MKFSAQTPQQVEESVPPNWFGFSCFLFPVSCCLLLCLLLLPACAAPTALAEPPSATPSPTVTSTPTPTATPTPTLTPTPTATPTPIPTIVILMLTPTVTPTATAEPYTVWQLPDRVIPEPFGVNIHFTRAGAQELDYLARGGFRWVRMDFQWHLVETELGKYNFSDYDFLVASMARRGIRLVFILDYGNPLYDHGYPPTSPGGRAAFARFAAAAAARYRDSGVIWEIWNEPNLDHFWTPKANAGDYGALALVTAAAIRRADPDALIVAPALCGYEWAFWETLGRLGLFQHLDAITVHSYGVLSPEEILHPYLALRALVDRHNPRWTLPILSGEWGFSTTEGGMSEGQQAQYLARQWLFNLAHDIHLNIWYDWHDDGPDPHDPEHHFGIVRHDYTAKPAYQAARALLTTLDGYRFMRRIPLERADDYLLLFQKDAQVALAVWTTGEAHTLILPIPTDDVETVDMLGNVSTLESQGAGLAVPVSPSPRYLVFRADQGAAPLGGWRPLNTINRLQAGAEESLRIVFENAALTPLSGEFSVRVQGQVRGTASVALFPEEAQQIRLPVDLAGLSGALPAEIVWMPDQEVGMAPLQSALVWVMVGK